MAQDHKSGAVTQTPSCDPEGRKWDAKARGREGLRVKHVARKNVIKQGKKSFNI